MTEPQALDVVFIVLDVDLMLENSPVFQTQGGDQMLALARAGLRVGLLTTSRNSEAFETAVGARLRQAGAWIRLVPHGRLVVNLLRMAFALRAAARRVRLRHAYTRGIWGPVVIAVAFPWSGLPYLYDVRGALADEAGAIGSARWKVWLLRFLERRAARGAAAVTAVSYPLAKQLERDYGRSDVVVVPSCVHVAGMRVGSEAREAARAACGFGREDVVLTYCGGLSAYQKVGAMLDLWERLITVPAVRFLLITSVAPTPGSDSSAPLRLDRFGSRLARLSVPRTDVPRVLSAGDIGFMLRDAHGLNRAASPVKFAEYLAAGLAVVASPEIGDISDLIVDQGLGCLVDPRDLRGGERLVRDFIERFQREPQTIRTRVARLAETRYDWDAYGPSLVGIYTRTQHAA